MMVKKIIGVVSVLIMLVGVLAGCTTSDGMVLSKAFIKSMDAKSAESDMKISLKVATEGIEIDDDGKVAIDLINNSSVELHAKQEVDPNRGEMVAKVNVDDITYNAKMYIDGQKMWFKMPFEQKYIEYDPAKLVDEEDEELREEITKAQEQAEKMVEELTPVIKEFVVDYIKDYKYNFKNLKNKGKEVVQTPEGAKEVTLYEITIDYDMLQELLLYTNDTVEEMINDGSLLEFVKSAMTVVAESNPEILEGQTLEEAFEEVDSSFEELKAAYGGNKEVVNEQIKMFIETAKQYCQIGPKGIKITYGIDNDSNIVKNDLIADVIISQGTEKVFATLEVTSVVYNINNTKVTIPEFNESEIVELKDLVENSDFASELPFAEYLGLNKKEQVVLTIGETTAYTSGGAVYLEAEPYIQDGSTMVPVRFIGESLGAEVSWRDEDKAIIYTDKDATVQMNIGSNIAIVNGYEVELQTAPVIKNGKAMVPLRFVTEELGAQIIWDEELQMITIEK